MAEQLLEGKITIITGGVEDLVNHLNRAETAGEGVADSVSEMASEAEKGSDQFEQVRTELDKVEAVMDEMSDRQIVDADGEARLADLRAEMDKFADESDEARLSLDEMQESAGMLKGDLRQSKSQVDKMANSNANARQSAMALGNIMSDLPHGPAAAANNVGNLVEGFGQMNSKGQSFMGIMKAMVGPALIGGLITGVATLAANWDRVSKKLEQAKMFLSGAAEEQRKLNKAVQELNEKAPDKIFSDLDSDEMDQARELVEALKEAKETEASPTIRGTDIRNPATSPTGMEAVRTRNKDIFNYFPQSAQNILSEGETALRKEEKFLEEKKKEFEKLRRTYDEITEQHVEFAMEQLRESLKEEGDGGDSDPGSDFELTGGLRPGYFGDMNMYPTQEPETDGPGRPPIPDSVDETLNVRVKQIDANAASAEEYIRSNVDRTTRQTTGPFVTGVTMNRKRRLAENRNQQRLNKVGARLTAARTSRLYTDEGTDRRKKFNARIKKLEAKRRQAKRKHADKMQRIREKEAQKEQRINNARIAGFQKFTGNISSIGNSLNSLYQTWRKQRVAELKKEGKSQKQINKKIKKEGKRRFKMMKKIRIAAAVADTIGASISAFRGTMQSSSFLGPAALPLAISSAAATAAAGYARVRKLQALSIGGGIPGKGGGGAGGGLGSTAKYKRLSGESRSSRVQNFAQEQARDSANDKSVQKTIEDEMGETRKAVREGMAIGDEDAFETQENANDYAKKATS